MRNSQYRGADLGTISSLNEYIAFRSAHGIDDNSYKDLYLGDYFQIVDGTYNAVWMVAHFDYYYNKGGSTYISPKGVVLIPRTTCGSSKMNNEDTTVGGYKSSIAHTTTCPNIANALQTVLGSYLLSSSKLISSNISSSALSMAGGSWQGASTDWEWIQDRCIIPSEVQIYGCTVASSSWYDIGEANQKLAVFNFINNVEYNRSSFWLRSVSSNLRFAAVSSYGYAAASLASSSTVLRPLIYIG